MIQRGRNNGEKRKENIRKKKGGIGITSPKGIPDIQHLLRSDIA